MAHSFKVGDRVVIVKSTWPGAIGLAATITLVEPLRRTEEGVPAGTQACTLDAVSPCHPGVFLCYPAPWLERYRDDSGEKAEWTDELRKLCKPRKVNA